MQSDWMKSRWFATLCATYLCLIAIASVLVSLLGAPHFWCLPASILLLLSIYLWRRPFEGASASLPIIFTFTVALAISVPWRSVDRTLIFLGLFLLGLAMCGTILITTGVSLKWLTTSIVLIMLVLATDYFFTDRLHIVTLQAQYSIDGTTPWGDDGHRDSKGNAGVLVYTRVRRGYCYDTVFYEPLREGLFFKHPQTVTIQYNTFSDFGRERSYNIRSIDGIVFNDNTHTVINADTEGGTSLDSGLDSPTCPR